MTAKEQNKLANMLCEISDEADHILGTEADNFVEMVKKDAKSIKNLADKALFMMGVK